MTDIESNFRRFGTYHTACGRILKRPHTAALDDEVMDNPPPGVDPVHHVIQGARAYAQAKGLADPHHGIDYQGIRTHRDLIRDLAHHYDHLPLNDPAAHKHFAAMGSEVNSQYHFLTNRMGLNVQVMDHDPYKNVHELRNDVVNNNQIKILGAHVTGGHPFFSNEENNHFRAVHDVFGHLATGRGFDRHGEEAAFQAHARMFTHHALPALASETRGQNSSLIVNGHFGPQRVGILPQHLWHPGLAQMNDRIAVIVNSLTEESGSMRVIAHVSGNSINILHCPFCGSGAVIGRSDGTIECGYCTTVFTVQVQPAYNGFPQSVDGQPYPWPGAPDPGDVLAPQAPPGTNLAPGTQPPMGMEGPPDSSDPADGDFGEDEDTDDDDKPDFLKGKDDKSDKKDSGKDDKKKGDNPFAKKSYIARNGAELPVDEFLAHIAITTAHDPNKAAQKVLESRNTGRF
jgi:hypothetical protein